MTMADLGITQRKWLDVWRYFEDLPHQRKAVEMLFDHINQADPSLLVEQAEWLEEYRNRAGELLGRKLEVPYFSQRDNASGTGYRECFSSSMAMIAAFHLPGRIKSDDQWNEIRGMYGDSTDVQAQLKALTYVGLTPCFRTDGKISDLKKEIREGRPVGVGWLHHGPVSNPQGGGHWSVVVGFTGDDRLIVNDPYGEACLLGGGYQHDQGKGVSYSVKNWGPRWMVEGEGTGWFLTVRS